jgi:hypothetical protein
MQRDCYVFAGPIVFLAASLIFTGCSNCSMTDHYREKKLEYFPNKIRLDVGTRYSTSYYDQDGKKQDLAGGAYERLFYGRLSYERTLVNKLEVGDSKVSIGGKTWLDFAGITYHSGNSGMSTQPDVSNSGLRSWGLLGDVSTHRLCGSPLSARFQTGFQLNLESKDDFGSSTKSPYSSGQSAFFIGTELGYPVHRFHFNAGAYYDFTFARDQNGFKVDNGNVFSLTGGVRYPIPICESVKLGIGLNATYLHQNATTYNGQTYGGQDKHYFGLDPSVRLGFDGRRLGVNLTYGFDDEFYHTRVGGIPLSGKNYPVSGGLTGGLNISYKW